MKIQIESTTKIIQLETPTGIVPARVWEGTTESGIAVQCLVTRIAGKREEDCTQFEAELQEHRPPSSTADAFPVRMIL